MPLGCYSSLSACTSVGGVSLSKCTTTPIDLCAQARDCGTCTQTGTLIGGTMTRCSWCVNTQVSGCFSACPITLSARTCSTSSSQGVSTIVYMAPTIAVGGSLVVGVVVGVVAMWGTLNKPDDIARDQSLASTLFFFSFVFVGCSLFSCVMSLRVAHRRPTPKLGCLCWLYFLAVNEFAMVVTGFVVGLSMSVGAQPYYLTLGNNLMLSVGIGVIYAAILVLGIPRIALGAWLVSHSRKLKLQDDPETDVDDSSGARQPHSAPLSAAMPVFPAVPGYRGPNQRAVSPIYSPPGAPPLYAPQYAAPPPSAAAPSGSAIPGYVDVPLSKHGL